MVPVRPSEARPVRLAAQVRKVSAPALGADAEFYVRMMTAGERAAIGEADADDLLDGRHWHCARVIQGTLCGPDGGLVFADDEIGLIASMPCGVADLLYEAGADFNGMTPAARERAERRIRSSDDDQYLYDLADRLGIPKHRLAEQITSPELTEYQARDRIMGPETLWENTALRCAMLNAFGKGPKFVDMIPEPMRWRINSGQDAPLDLSGLWDEI